MTLWRQCVNMEKTKLQIYLDPEAYIELYNYAKNHALKNYSQAISKILIEWRRFRLIAQRMQQDAISKTKPKQEGLDDKD